LEKASWKIVLQDAKGEIKGETLLTSTMPANARNATYEAFLVAALTAKLPEMRSWLAAAANESPQ
jgi:hypothetical protein